jgi:hypothetical protein
MRAAALIACTLLALILGVVPGQAEKRIALVIGNSTYRNAPSLLNPANDAGAMADLFKAARFDDVQLRLNVGIADLRRAVRDFSDSAADADIAVVYFAGHGIEIDGANYLIPIDAKLARDFDIEDETFNLDRVLSAIEPARRLRLIILDACRDNPFVKTMKRLAGTRSIGRGLARIEPAGSNTLVAFAAKAGSVAFDGESRNSPFTAALLKHIATPGLDIRLAFGRVRDDVRAATGQKQEPFEYGSLGGQTISIVDGPVETPASIPQPAVSHSAGPCEGRSIVLIDAPCPPVNQTVAVQPSSSGRTPPVESSTVTTPSADPSGDELAWGLIKDSLNADLFERFIRQFPNSPHRSEAEQRIHKIANLPVDKPLPGPPPAHITIAPALTTKPPPPGRQSSPPLSRKTDQAAVRKRDQRPTVTGNHCFNFNGQKVCE